MTILLTGAIASAKTGGTIGIYADSSGAGCVVDSGGLIRVHIIHSWHLGAIASQFALDVPGSWIWMGDNWNYQSIGTSITGVAIVYGGCRPAPTYLGWVDFIGSSTSCTEIRIVPDPNVMTQEILGVDCDTNFTYPYGLTTEVNCRTGPCQVLPPHNLQPPDGAVDVPLSTTLSWEWIEPTGCPEGIGMTVFQIFIGTHPDSLVSLVPYDIYSPWPVGPLKPGTTYYWYMKVTDDFWNCPGPNVAVTPIQIFTTTDDVPSEQSTWGRIKSLFR